MEPLSTWRWSTPLLEAFTEAGLAWKVVTHEWTRNELKSSPDYAIYRDRTVLLQADTPERWVTHELGHWLAAQALAPHLLDHPNYGWDHLTDDEPPADEWDRDDENGLESIASSVALALLVKLDLDWRDYIAHIRHDRDTELYGVLDTSQPANEAERVLGPGGAAELRALEMVWIDSPSVSVS